MGGEKPRDEVAGNSGSRHDDATGAKIDLIEDRPINSDVGDVVLVVVDEDIIPCLEHLQRLDVQRITDG